MLPNLFYTINFSLAIIISTIALILAFLTIIIFVINRQCRTVSNLLTCNTAIVVIFYHILNLISCVYGLRDDGFYNQPACTFRAYFYSLTCAAFCYSYLIQAISRLFFAIFYKYRSLFTWRVHWLMIIINWLISIAVPIVPIFYNGGYVLEEESRFCIATTKVFFTSMYTVCADYLFPFSVAAVIYGTIFYHVRRSTRSIISFTSPFSNIPMPNAKREIRLMKNMLILIGILTCGGMPYFTLVIWHVTQHQPPKSFYLFAINSITLFTALMMVTMFFMSKEVKKCTITYLLKLC